MTADLQQITDFLAKYAPFSKLPAKARAELSQSIEIAYYRAGNQILNFADPIQDLYVIRSGSVEVYRRTGELYNRLSEGDIFGQMSLLMNRRVRFPAKALQDTLVYCIPADLFTKYCDCYENFSDFFESDERGLLRQTVSSQASSNDMTTAKIKSLLFRDLVSVNSNTSIREAAKLMTEQRVSSLLVTDSGGAISDSVQQSMMNIKGIITDRDFRKRVLAACKKPDDPVADIMTTDLQKIDSDSYVYEAMLIMLRYNIHHLPVIKNYQPIGVVSLSDIVRYESQSSLLLVRGIYTQQSVEDLKNYAQQLPMVFIRMVNEDANSHMIGSAMALIGRCFKQRLLELAEEKLGTPPVPYCFLALGSMARNEQIIVTDQDNAIILDNSYRAELHEQYFSQLAEFVCNGLIACGYKRCTGNIMATNSDWRMTLDDWKNRFSYWIEKPTPEALLHCSIFFDLDGVYGRKEWARQLQKLIADKSRGATTFLACLARNALNRTPPLGFFRGFVLEQDGEHKNSINIKRRGTAPLSDLVRVHALAAGSEAQNSFERLEDIEKSGLLPPGKSRDLSDALEYISLVRIRYQARDLEEGREPDNNIEPENLSAFERRNLKEAFQVIVNAQSFLKFRYHTGLPLPTR